LNGLTRVSLTNNFELEFKSFTHGDSDDEKQLAKAWNSLASADIQNIATFRSVQIVLNKSYISQSDSKSIISLSELIAKPVTVKPTAANPRAFKGTKRQLLKNVGQKNIDLRPYLLSPNGIKQVIALSNQPEKDFSEGFDPTDADFLTLPVDFRISFLMLMQNEDWAFINKFLKLYLDLNLDKSVDLKRLSLRILYLASAKGAYQLLNSLLSVCEELRLPVLLEVVNKIPRNEIAANIGTICDCLKLAVEFESKIEFSKVWKFLLSGIRSNASIELMRFSLELYYDYSEALPFQNDFSYLHLEKTANSLRRQSEIRSLLDYFAERQKLVTDDWVASFRDGIYLATYCANSTKNEEIFQIIPWRKLGFKSAIQLLRLLHYNDFPKSIIQPVVNFLLKHQDSDTAKSFLIELEIISQNKNLNDDDFPCFLNWFIEIEDTDSSWNANLADVCFQLYFGFDQKNRETLLRINENSIHHLIKSCYRLNDANLICSALKTLQRLDSNFLLLSLDKSPKSLFKVLRTMACLNQPLREKAFKKFEQQNIFRLTCDESPDSQRKFLEELIDYSCTVSITRKVREAIAKNLELSPLALQRAADEVKPHVERYKLEYLEKLLFEAMSDKNLFEMQNNIRHAFKLLHQNNNKENSRAFKKFLNHYLDGDTNYIINHQCNQNWLKKNNLINFDPWLKGFNRRYHLGVDKKTYTLKIELDPLEELKHGTYVGTCTGIGGNHSLSAIGTVLDINKRVIYAFDDHNHIVLRQIVAVTTEGKLACLSVYPDSATTDEKQLFFKFNKDLAYEMQIEIAPEDYDYRVEFLLATFWYHDFQFEIEKNNEESNR
jgi:hypothetical protein